MATGTPRDDHAVYVISIAAELAGMHPQTLRIYERKGLIEPSRTEGRSRRYSEADIETLRRIQALTNDGVSLAGVKRILELEAQLARLQRELQRTKRQLEAAASELTEAVARVQREYRRDLVPFGSRIPMHRPRP